MMTFRYPVLPADVTEHHTADWRQGTGGLSLVRHLKESWIRSVVFCLPGEHVDTVAEKKYTHM